MNFFLEKLGGPFFYLRVHLPWGYTIPSLVWFEQLLDPIKRPIFKIPFPRNLKSSLWNTNFFPRQAIPKILFVLHLNYTGDTRCRVWFDLDNSLTRWKDLFLKFLLREIQKVPYEILTFFPGKLYEKLFSFYILTTPVILHAKFGLIWTAPWPDEKKPTFKIPFSRNSKSSVWNTNFFPRQAIPKIIFVYILITLVILHAEFGLIWATPWPDKISIFLKIE